MRVVADVARQHGVLGEDHAQRIVEWADHLNRKRNERSVASLLFSWHDADWLQQRRCDPLIGRSQRLGTRFCSGPFSRRWDESVDAAVDAVSTRALSRPARPS